MRRITVSVTVEDSYNSSRIKRIRMAMTNAAVGKATEEDVTILAIESKVGIPRKSA